ncbi:MAG: hypothetical protein SFX72_18480 [Isosphaeraceae bacterium]|nr:hypothetical protein [Isosphaeraceae bacterium]
MSHARRVRYDAARPFIFPLPPLQSNRRSHDRYVPVEDRAWLGWWEGTTFRTTEATLLNISKGGTLVESEIAPPRRSIVWICLEGSRRTEWVPGKVLEVAREENSPPQTRVMFDEICPYAFFEVAVYGWQAARDAPIIKPNYQSEDPAEREKEESLPGLSMMMY